MQISHGLIFLLGLAIANAAEECPGKGGKGHAVGSTWDEECAKLTCVDSKKGEYTVFETKLVSFGCSDEKGGCVGDGKTYSKDFQGSKVTCTCKVDGLKASASCVS